MAQLARTQNIGLTAEDCVAPDQADALVRIRNLDAVNFVVVSIKPGVVATIPQGDEMVRVGPGENYYARRLTTYSMIADTATCDVELEVSQGRT